jgi:hypothetical protein
MRRARAARLFKIDLVWSGGCRRSGLWLVRLKSAGPLWWPVELKTTAVAAVYYSICSQSLAQYQVRIDAKIESDAEIESMVLSLLWLGGLSIHVGGDEALRDAGTDGRAPASNAPPGRSVAAHVPWLAHVCSYSARSTRGDRARRCVLAKLSCHDPGEKRTRFTGTPRG